MITVHYAATILRGNHGYQEASCGTKTKVLTLQISEVTCDKCNDKLARDWSNRVERRISNRLNF